MKKNNGIKKKNEKRKIDQTEKKRKRKTDSE